MIVRADKREKIVEFLKTNHIVNLNILGIIDNVPSAEIYADSMENPTGVLVRDGYMHYLYTTRDGFIDEMLDTFMKDGFFGFSGVEHSIAEKVKKRYEVTWESPCTLYYMPEPSVDLSRIKNTVTSIDINDACTVDKYYTYRNSTSLDRIRENITNRPSSAIYVNGDMACWVLVHEDDSMGIMYTKEEYRNRGYAVDVTLDLASKIIKNGKIPFLQIVKGNNMSPGLAKKCGFIEHGYATWFGILAGMPKELVDLSSQCGRQFAESLPGGIKGHIIKPGSTWQSMYLFLNHKLEEYKAMEGFYVGEASSEDEIRTWCRMVCSGYGAHDGDISDFRDQLYSMVCSKDSAYSLYMGYLDGVPVSACGLLKTEDDVCGIYFLTVSPEYSQPGLDCGTVAGALRESMKKGFELAMLYLQDNNTEQFNKLGFKFIQSSAI